MADITGAHFARHGITPPGGSIAPEANAPAGSQLLSDWSAHITGSGCGSKREQLSLFAPPAVLLPVMERTGDWMLESVADAFNTQRAAQQAQFGIVGVDFAGYGSASLMWAKDEQAQ